MNVVCLTGELAREQSDLATSPRRAGCTSFVLEVQREGDDAPGVVPVLLAVPRALVGADDIDALWPGRPILVIGKLEVDVDYAHERRVAHHSVIVHRLELMPSEGGAFVPPAA